MFADSVFSSPGLSLGYFLASVYTAPLSMFLLMLPNDRLVAQINNMFQCYLPSVFLEFGVTSETSSHIYLKTFLAWFL